MKHLIIVKSAETVQDVEGFARRAEAHFAKILTVEGVHAYRVIRGIREHENRYHFIIEIDMDKEALPAYNASACHREWKEAFGHMIGQKAIFDYED